jgi:hypothetical protein
MLAVCAHATSVETANNEQKRAAQKVFEAADELYESGRYEEAAQAFKASYDLVSSPNSRLMWARALRELKRFDEARTQYEGTIRDAEASGGRYPEAQKAAQSELEALQEIQAYIIIDAAPANAPTEVRINGQVVAWSAGERIAAPTSKVKLTLHFADGTVENDELVLQSGETRHIATNAVVKEQPATPMPAPKTPVMPPQESKRAHNPTRTAAYVSGAVGVAGLATFAVFGLLNRSVHSDLESKCPNNACPISERDTIDAGRRYQTIGNIGLGVGAVGTAAAVTLYLLSTKSSTTERGAALMVGPGSLSLSGRF